MAQRVEGWLEYFGVYHQAVDPVTAFVLAGGRSSRMGPNHDKAFLQFGGRTLLSHALELAQGVGDTRIVGRKEKFAGFGPVVEDLYSGQGPLAGIHAALKATKTDLNLIIAVDMPFLQPDFLDYLVAQAHASAALIVVPRTAEGFQPLCAVYRREFADGAEQALRAGRNKIDLLFTDGPVRVVDEVELHRNHFSEEMFRNLNTQADWEEAKQNLSAR